MFLKVITDFISGTIKILREVLLDNFWIFRNFNLLILDDYRVLFTETANIFKLLSDDKISEALTRMESLRSSEKIMRSYIYEIDLRGVQMTPHYVNPSMKTTIYSGHRLWHSGFFSLRSIVFQVQLDAMRYINERDPINKRLFKDLINLDDSKNTLNMTTVYGYEPVSMTQEFMNYIEDNWRSIRLHSTKPDLIENCVYRITDDFSTVIMLHTLIFLNFFVFVFMYKKFTAFRNGIP